MTQAVRRIREEGIRCALESHGGELVKNELERWGEPKFVSTTYLRDEDPTVIRYLLHFNGWSEELLYHDYGTGEKTVFIRLYFEGGVKQQRMRTVN